MRFSPFRLALLIGIFLLGMAVVASAQPLDLPAGVEPRGGSSFAAWIIRVSGLAGLMVMASGLAVFIGACLVVIRSRRPAVIKAYLVFLPLPLMFGVYGALKGNISSLSVVAMSEVTLTSSEIAGGVAESLLLPFEAMTVIFPSYFVIAIGLFIRTLAADPSRTLQRPMAGSVGGGSV